jgi:hypothetical protein
MAYTKFFPVSPDTFLKAGSDMALAKFGHLNSLIDYVNTAVDYNSTTGMTLVKGQDLNIVSGSGATVTLTTSQSGSVVLMDRATGITFTLPVATSSTIGMYFDFVVTTSVTSNGYKVITGAATEFLLGGYTSVDTDSTNAVAVFTGNGSSHISVNMTSASTNATGGLQGTKLRFTCLSTTRWMVEGIVMCAGTPATAFATS